MRKPIEPTPPQKPLMTYQVERSVDFDPNGESLKELVEMYGEDATIYTEYHHPHEHVIISYIKTNMKSEDVYKRDLDKYNKKMDAYNKEMKAYPSKLKAYEQYLHRLKISKIKKFNEKYPNNNLTDDQIWSIVSK